MSLVRFLQGCHLHTPVFKFLEVGMAHARKQVQICLAFSVLFFASACLSSAQSDVGVAKVIDSTSELPIESKTQYSDTSENTDEKAATLFASCMRDNGFDMADPELNSDGTVRWGNFKESLKDPLINEGGLNLKTDKGSVALDECSPLLETITLADEKNEENEIEMQDKLLTFAQCLRDNGLEVDDPIFSEGSRSAMKPVVEDIKGSESRVEEITDLCLEQVYGAANKK